MNEVLDPGLRDFSDKTEKVHGRHGGTDKNLVSTTPPLCTPHPCPVTEGNVNYREMLITCFLTVELRRPLVQGCRREEQNRTVRIILHHHQLIPSAFPTTFWRREGARYPSQS